MSEEKTVFISYRRKASAFIARAIFEHLRLHDYDVFMDVESIGPGQFERIIRNQIRARAHFLVILAPGSLEGFKEPDDWLRREIEWAIDMQRNVVPVMANGFHFHDYAEYLTGPVSTLQGFNALPLYHEFFNEAMQRLRDVFLQQPYYGEVEPAPESDAREVQEALEEAVGEPSPSEEDLSAESHYNNGLTLYEAKAYEVAILSYSEAIRLKPDYPFAYNNRGIARSKSGNLAAAIADYTEAIRLKPDEPIVYSNRGIAHADSGNHAAAIADYTEAIPLKPDYAIAYNNRGWARYQAGNHELAMADYNEAIRLKPDYAFAYNNRGNAHSQSGGYTAALADYDEAIRFKPDFAEAYNNRGIARGKSDNLAAALADFNEAIRLKPDYADAYTNRGYARNLSGDHTAAIVDFNEAIRLKPDDAVVYSNRGEAHFATTNYVAALADFEHALTLEPDYIFALAERAITLHALNHVDEALDQWRELVAKDTRYRDADWTGKEFGWRPELVEEARKLIAKL